MGNVETKPNRLGAGRSAFLLLLAGYALLAGFLAFRLPPFVGPNEALHYEYVALMRQTGRLPDLATSFRADERHQPPVYYSLATLLGLPFSRPPLDSEFSPNPHFPGALRGNGNLNPFVHLSPANAPVAYAGRLASILFGLLAVTALYAAARLTLPPDVSLLAAALLAFQPTFLYLSATMNNDLAVTAVAALLIAYTTYLLVKEKAPPYYFGWGVLLALALLTKASAIFLLLLLPIACWHVWRRTGQLWPAAQSALWGAAGFTPLYGGWLLFNHARSGDALGLAPSVPIWHLLTLRPADLPLLLANLGELFRSFWLDWSPGILGYGPGWLYAAAAALLLFALLGWFWPRSTIKQPVAIVLMHLGWSAALAAAFFAVKTLMVRDIGFLVPEGRWLLPAWPSLAWLLAVGWGRWWGQRRAVACGAATAVLPLTALLLAIFFLPQLYPNAQRLAGTAQILPSATLTDLLYDGRVELTAVATDAIYLNQPTPVTLYWRAHQSPTADYTITAQLLVPAEGQWLKLAETRSFPGGGLSPTSGWRAGERYRDRLVLLAEGEVAGPTTALLGIWLDAGETAVQTQQQGQPTDWPIAAQTVVRPAQPLSLPPDRLDAPVQFGDLFALAAISQEATGEEWRVTLWWQAQQAVAADYVIFVHALDESGNLVAQADGPPVEGSSPTSIWQPGDVVRDARRLPLAASPISALLIGVYDPATGQRLPAQQGGVPLPDAAWRYEMGFVEK